MATHRILRRALTAAVASLALACAPAHAESLRLHPRTLLAHNTAGAQPNAPATDPALSGDGRIVRYAAYASAATDIVPGSGPFKNIFLVHRAPPFSLSGTPWVMGDTTLVSRGAGGQPADGDSWDPSFDGYDYAHAGREYTVAPRCLAFVSNASNLVPGDTNGIADVFVMHLATGKVTRIASAGAASAVALDGRCFNVSYVAGGTVYTKNIGGIGKGNGKVRRLSAIGGASSPAVSANGRVTVYERNGAIYVNRDGRNRFVAAGSEPSTDDWGRYVAYTVGGQVWEASILGSAHSHQLSAAVSRRDGQRLMNGSWPSMTTGGHFVFFVTGNMIDSNVYEKFASCPAGDAVQVAGSPHGNYAAYSCSDGSLYMSYVGGR
jgi:hypothetical protein